MTVAYILILIETPQTIMYFYSAKYVVGHLSIDHLTTPSKSRKSIFEAIVSKF